MTPEEKSLLLRTHELAEENNRILRKMRRANRWATIAKISYLVIILALAFGAYYFIQPYFETVLKMTGKLDAGGGASTIQEFVKNLPR